MCRRIGCLKVTIFCFLALALLCFSVQMNHLPLSSAKLLDKKESSEKKESIHDSFKLPVVTAQLRFNKSSEAVNQPKTARVKGNSRSPKQVNEEVFKTPVLSEETENVKHKNPQNNTKPSLPQAYEDPLPSMPGPNSLQLLQDILVNANKAQTIRNSKRFPALSEDSLVLIVQVHKREGYLKQLLESLKVARGIEKVLLVISHDYYYDDMNKLIESVDFCPVLQIFYPFSLQVMPTTFPGSSPNDCPRDAGKEKAIRMKCINAQHPDSYGHYREAIVTAIKHHWWWKVNMVFDGLRVTQNYTGYVVFLEEDHYVSPDFIEVAHQLMKMKKEKCHDCDFINLGMYNKAKVLTNRASAGIWNAGKNNMGFGMDRSTWNLIKNCSKFFCTYDDYNWDWSLNQLGKACPLFRRDLKVLDMKSPRIFHIGTCGTHHHKSCNEAHQARTARDFLTRQAANLFPSQLTLDHGLYPALSRKKIKPYGGWGDTRDHNLCMKFMEKDFLLGTRSPT